MRNRLDMDCTDGDSLDMGCRDEVQTMHAIRDSTHPYSPYPISTPSVQSMSSLYVISIPQIQTAPNSTYMFESEPYLYSQ